VNARAREGPHSCSGTVREHRTRATGDRVSPYRRAGLSEGQRGICDCGFSSCSTRCRSLRKFTGAGTKLRGDRRRTKQAWYPGLAHFQRGGGIAHIGHDRQRPRPGTTSRKNFSFLPPVSDIWFARPVTLPPGRARLATSPVPDWVRRLHENDRDDRCRLFCRERCWVCHSDNDIDLSRTNSAAISA
jgi:hypothetical protein